MKRSQMLRIITNLLSDSYPELEQNGRHYRTANKVLDKLENKGMKPPLATVKKYYDAFGIENCGSYIDTSNRWEKEDEA